MSWATEVIADSYGKWTGNACRFAYRNEAESYAADLFTRCTAVKAWRVVDSDDPVNYVWADGRAKALPSA